MTGDGKLMGRKMQVGRLGGSIHLGVGQLPWAYELPPPPQKKIGQFSVLGQ